MENVKRFWTAVTVAPDGDFHAIHLDGRPLRTPARAPLRLPSAALAHAIAAEWETTGHEINPRAMPFTGLANAAIDLAAEDRAGFAARLASYAESDLLCYRADWPQPLIERQSQQWEPLLLAVEQRLDSHFHRTTGIVHVAQPEGSLQRVQQLLASYSPFRLAALDPIVTIAGSAVVGLALAEGLASAEQLFAAATLDERWQEEQWGADAEATASRESRQAQFMAAARFLELAGT